MLCSSFHLKAKDDDLLGLVDHELQSLSLADAYEGRLYFLGLPKLDRLTGLTRLELLSLGRVEKDSLDALRHLELQELVLLNCNELERELFVRAPEREFWRPGPKRSPMQALKKLHIEDSKWSEDRAEDDDRQLAIARQIKLEKAADVVLQLPKLRQLSGLCRLFDAAMGQGLRSWVEAECPDGTMVTHKSQHRCRRGCLKVWYRPGSY